MIPAPQHQPRNCASPLTPTISCAKRILSVFLRLAFVPAVFLSCRGADPETRARLDGELGRLTTDAYQFEATAGSLHILPQSGSAELRLRASQSNWSFRLTNRLDSTMQLTVIIHNMAKGSGLSSANEPLMRSPEGVLASRSDGEQSEPGLLSRRFQIELPAQGSGQFAESQADSSIGEFSFLATGDIQDGIEDFGDVTQKLQEQTDVDFFLFLGDVTMRNSSKEFAEAERSFHDIPFPVYVTPGNHDVSRSHSNYQQYFGRGSYSFEHRGARFTSLDTAGWTLSETAWSWYRNWLNAGLNQLHIVYGHIAPTESFGVRGGHWSSRREAAAFQALAARGRVDALLFGHLHTLDIFRLAGIPTFISGGAGAFEEKNDGINRHLLRFDVDPVKQTIRHSVILVE